MATWSKAPDTPFGTVAQRILLDSDPLVRVVAQVRFSPVLSIREPGFIAPFQEAIRVDYPLVRREQQQQVALGAQGALAMDDSVLWRFSDVGSNWQVTLSDSFVSLDCGDYTERADFMGRLSQALAAVGDYVRPVLAHSVGVRYVDRLADTAKLEQLRDFIRPEMLGLSSAGLSGGQAATEMTHAEFAVGRVSLLGRWGYLPPGATHDPSIEPVDGPSWILDLDAYTSETTPFDAVSCADDAEQHASTVYGFFRWAVSDEFLTAHGATL
ncbi:MAG: TIGR04255 family protein [bacterium]|nr:TIGR04255 family protein [bacterium]MCY4193819.1 TIGR04255 family protein [bacterium]MCY4272737.1 TIGR04255 family protein [bacterium]